MRKIIAQMMSFVIFTMSLGTYVAFGADIIDRRYEYQEKSNWCWLASAKNLVLAERPKSRPPTKTQSDAAIHVLGNTENLQGYLNDVVDAADYISDGDYGYIIAPVLSCGTLIGLIRDLNSPAYLNIQHPDKGGHAIMMYGIGPNSVRDMVIFDPAEGRGMDVVNYDQLRNGQARAYDGYVYEDTIYCTAHY